MPAEAAASSTFLLPAPANSEEDMPSQPAEAYSPIANIPPEILWRIFSLIAVMDQRSDHDNTNPALDSLRGLSHVCSHWRRVLLGAPSIWSQALNLRHLARLSPEWQVEIVRRTEEAEMDILAKYCLPGDPLISDFVGKHWHRVRSLNCAACGSFLASGCQAWSNIAERPSNRLFHLSIVCSPWIMFDFLTSIALAKFPHLQSLEIIESSGLGKTNATEFQSFPSASLPRLKDINAATFSDTVAHGVLEFLDSIKPAGDCILRLSSEISFRHSPPPTIHKVSSIFQKYSKLAGTASSSSRPKPARRTVVAILQDFIDIRISDASERVSTFKFSLRDVDDAMTPELQHETELHQNLPEMISSLCSSISLSTIEELELKLLESWSDKVYSALERLLTTLTAVKGVLVNDGALYYIDALQSRRPSSTLIFPSCQVIRFFRRPDLRRVKSFLEAQKARGAEMEQCTLMFLLTNDEKADFSVLDGLTGLTVKTTRLAPDLMNQETIMDVIPASTLLQSQRLSSTPIFPSLRTIGTYTQPYLPPFKRYLESRRAMGATLESFTLTFPLGKDEIADLTVLNGLKGSTSR
ncbi:hypothetical protein CVT26_000901 [Gymnopilus dilepis]|uniref:Uncharacterized protein n=1 Tax=Gymnopilus dilepis TaxID=231916 RepID=A0A409WYW9_9AGAR|nr:hypothetical protein CVT26_000901 [Gymnopilus dilepis]